MFSILFPPAACSAEYKTIKSECNQRGEKINTCNFMKVMLAETGHCSSYKSFLPQVNKTFYVRKINFLSFNEIAKFPRNAIIWVKGSLDTWIVRLKANN